MQSWSQPLVRLWAVLALLFCLPGVVNADVAVQPKVLRIATVAFPYGSTTVFSGAPGILEKEGWLADELKRQGVRLEWVPVSPQSVAATINEAFANHSIDFDDYGDLPSIILNAGGISTRVLAGGGRGSNVYLIVPSNSTASSILDLKGKRIALHRGRPWEITFARLAAANGLKLSDFRILNLNPQAGAAAIAAGNADAIVTLFDGFPLVDKGIGKIIWSTKRSGQEWKMRAELWGAAEFMEKYPALTQAVVSAHVRAAHWASQEKNFDEYLKLTARAGQPESFTRREYLEDSVSWKDRWSPLLDDTVVDHYRYTTNYSRESGIIRGDLDSARLFEPKFLDAALKELHLESYWVNPQAAVKVKAK